MDSTGRSWSENIHKLATLQFSATTGRTQCDVMPSFRKYCLLVPFLVDHFFTLPFSCHAVIWLIQVMHATQWAREDYDHPQFTFILVRHLLRNYKMEKELQQLKNDFEISWFGFPKVFPCSNENIIVNL